MFCLRQLYAAAFAKDEALKEALLDTLRNLICESLKENLVTRQARKALSPPRSN
jgi:hypothetical protein